MGEIYVPSFFGTGYIDSTIHWNMPYLDFVAQPTSRNVLKDY